jgi:DNA-binding NtrC family response regulator
MREVFRLLDRITDTEVTVLIQGESGTGKELVARALHVNGPRSKGPFVAENCGAVPEGLLESVLFGHVKGAFTGAAGDRKGLFELATGGTLFLDEVGEMPPSMQVKLLRALQESEVRRIGAAAPVKVNVRVIAATNRDLREEVAAKRFREDLFYRLDVVRVPLPPLRERAGDVPLLARHFLARFQEQLGTGPASISGPAMGKLTRHSWPGNIRELENVLKSAYLLSTGKEIAPGDLKLAAPAAEPPALRLLQGAKIGEMEERLIRDAMEKAAGRVAAAAELLGMPERTLYHKLARLGLKRKRR